MLIAIGINLDHIEMFVLGGLAFTINYRVAKDAELKIKIAKQIIEIHDGRIWVESEYGKGSKFIFTLPLTSEADQYQKGRESEKSRIKMRREKW